MAVDDGLQLAVGIVADATLIVEHHHFTILGSIGLPGRQAVNIRTAVMSKLCPHATHSVCQFQVVCRGLGQLIGRVMQRVETELQFMTMHRALVDGRTPGEHIHIHVPTTRHGIGGDKSLGAEEPVNAHQVLRCVIGIGLGESLDIGISLVAEGLLELFTGLVHRHRLVILQALQFVEGGADEHGYVG